MKTIRINELGRKRHAKIKMAEIFNGTVLGIFALWGVWVSTSLLIHLDYRLLKFGCATVAIQLTMQTGTKEALLDLNVPAVDVVTMPFV